jgi:hypothetical protein
MEAGLCSVPKARTVDPPTRKATADRFFDSLVLSFWSTTRFVRLRPLWALRRDEFRDEIQNAIKSAKIELCVISSTPEQFGVSFFD